MVKFLRTILMACLLLASVIPSQAQKIMGYVEDYRYTNITTQEYAALTDVIYSFLEFNTDGTLIGAAISPATPSTVSSTTFGWDQTAYANVKSKCKTKKGGSGPRLHIALGGADNPGARAQRFYDVANNTTARAKLIDQVVKWAIQEGIYGIALDWEFPATWQVSVHEALLRDFRTAINASADPSLILTIDVGGEYKNTINHLQYVTQTALSYIDELHIMSYDLPTSYSANHSTVTDATKALDQWKLTYNFPYNKMLLGVPFYGWDASRVAPRLYKDEASYTTAYNKTDESITGSYYYNSKDALEKKVDYLYNKGGQGIVIWAVGGDRQMPDAYSLLNVIQAKTISRCAPMPNLGPDVGVCLTTDPGGITLNSGVAAQSGRTFVWKNGSTVLSSTGPTLSGVTTSGTYSVTITENGCPNSDDIVVTASNAVAATGGSICGSGQVTLTATGSGTFNWFDQPAGGSLLSTGAVYKPTVSATTDFYVQDQGTAVTNTTGKAVMDNTKAVAAFFGKATDPSHVDLGHKIVVTSALKIKSLAFTIAPSMSGTMSINVVSSADNKTVLQSAGPFAYNNASATNGQTYTFTTNLSLNPGTYYIMPVSTTGSEQKYWAEYTGSWSTTQPAKPDYTIPGVIAVSGNCYNDWNDGLGVRTAPNVVYVASLYAWEIETGSSNACGRTKVTATVIPGANAGLAVTATTPTVCVNGSSTGTVTIGSSESGIVYQAYVSTASAPTLVAAGGTVTGTGSNLPITIPAASLTSAASTGTTAIITIIGTKSGCGATTLTNTASINLSLPAAQPSVITGLTTVTQGQTSVAYSVTNVPGVTYTWTYTGGTGATITGTGNAITISYSASATSGTLSVTATNAPCLASTPRTLAITVNSATVNPTITYSAQTKVYGDASFSMTATSNSTGAITYSVQSGTAATITSAGVVTIVGAGTVTFIANQVAASGYNAGSATATLTIAKKALTVTADNKNKAFNTANPALTITYSGFAYSDNAASLTTQATATTTAVTTSPAGTYPITPAGAVSNNYTFTYVNGTLTVSPATAPTITFTSASKIYGDASFSMTATSNSTGGITYAVTGGSGATITSAGVVTITGAGSVTITATQAAAGSFSAGTATATLTIAKKALTVTADNKNKAFNTANPALTITYSGFVYTDNAASLTTLATATTTAVTTSPAGTYPITPAGAVSNNYTFTYVNGTLTVNSASAPTITFNGASKVYGDASFSMTATSNSTGAITYAVTGGSGATITSAGVVTITGAGSVTITATQAAAGSFSAGSATATLTIAKKALTVTADNKNKAFNTANPALTVTYSGFAYSDVASSLTTQATATTTAVTSSPAGTYPITPAGAVSNNYTFTYVNGTLTVNSASAPTIVFNGVSKVYGDASFSMTTTSSTSSGAITYAVTGGSGATITSAGVVTITGAGSVTITATQAAAGSFSAGSATATLTIAKKALTVTADNKNKAFNTANPALTVTYSGFAYTDNAASLTTQATATTTAVTSSPAGTYPITPAGAVSNNYTFTYVNGTLTVNSASTPTIVFNGVSKVYGDASFSMTTTSSTSSGAITYAVTGGSGATITSAGVVTITGAGSVTITATQAAAGSFSAGSATATLTIAKKALTVTADNKNKAFNTANPALTITYSGFAYTDNAASLTTQATATTTAVTTSPAGTYPITPAGAVSNNYTFTYVNGTLTVNPGTTTNPTITFNNVSKIYGDASFSMTANSNSTGAITYAVTAGSGATITSAGVVTITGAGTVTITATQAAAGTFNAGTATATLTIGKATRTATITSANSGSVGTTVSLTNTVSAGTGAATWSVVNGTGSATVSVTTLSLATVGTVTVKVDIAADANYNATSATQTFTIGNASGTPTPGAITGANPVSTGQVVTYCVPNVTGTTYTWKYTGYNVMIQNNNTNCVTITFNSSAVGGTLSVTANNGSGESLPSEMVVSIATTGIEDAIAGLKLEVYPNPFEYSSTISFDLPYGAIVDMDVYSMHGVKVKTLLTQAALSSGINSFTLSEIPNGIYIVRVKIGNSEKNIKVVKN